MLITDLPSIDVEALRSRLYGDVFGPGRRRMGRGPARVEPRRRPAARRGRAAADRRRRRRGRRTSPARKASASPRRAPATARPRSRSLENTILLSTRHMRGVRIDPVTRTRPRPRRRAVGRRHRARERVRPRPAGRLVARRRRRRLHARRRPELARAQARVRVRQRHSRSSSSPPTASCVKADAHIRSRAVPRAVRRRRELRRRDRDRVQALPGRVAHGGRDGVAVGARPGDLHRLARVDRARPGRHHVAVPDAAGPGHAGRPGRRCAAASSS